MVFVLFAAIQVNGQGSSRTSVSKLFTPTSIPDGILVTGGDDTRAHIATWTVLVTLDVPTLEVSLLPKLSFFQRALRSHHAYSGISNETKNIWNERSENLKATINRRPTIHRTRRGLLNIIGTLSNTLFGTATEDEVFETRKQIDLLTKKNNQIVHVARQLITIVNQTNEHSRRINEHINSIQTYVSKVAHQISATQRKLDSNNRRFNILSATVATDRALALVETTHHLWLRQQDLYDRQRAALELGYFTEYILPAKHLQNIFNLAAKSDMYGPSIEWYYSHITVHPLLQNDSVLVFRADLPLTDRNLYLRYRIQTWPVPGNSSEFLTQLQAPSDIAFHTATGEIFQPIGCIGIRLRSVARGQFTIEIVCNVHEVF